MTQAPGRHDQHVPIFSARERGIALIVAFVAAAVLAWHVAVVMTTAVELGHLFDSLEAGFDDRVETSTFIVLALILALEFAALIGLLRLKNKVFKRGSQSKGFAERDTVRSTLSVERARERSFDEGMPLRPGLSRSVTDVHEHGLWVGEEVSSGSEVVVGFDDHICVFAPTGGGKSSRLMIPAAQTAPGALVVTTNEATILDAIAMSRRDKGRMWVFDPLGRTHWPEPMVWDPVAGCEDADRATARAGAFCMAVKSATVRSSDNSSFFADTASTALETMLHAAALDRRGIGDVLGWAMAMSEGVETPRTIIERSKSEFAEPLWSRALRGVAEGADDTVASTRTTLQRQIKPLMRRSVQRWIDPAVAQKVVDEARERIAEEGGDSSRIANPAVFDPHAFVRSTDTLVLVSDANASTDVSPLCSMVFQEVMDAVKDVASESEHQRIDPPIRVVGDEIANVAPIPKLPEQSTEVRKLGVQLIIAVQDLLQVTSRWGEAEGMKLINQMAFEIVFPGVKSDETLQRFSKLIGTVEVVQRSDNVELGSGHRQSSGLSTQERQAMRPEEIRKMADGTALVVYRNLEPFMIHMPGWWERKGGQALSTAAKGEAKARAARGQQTRRERDEARARHHEAHRETAS